MVLQGSIHKYVYEFLYVPLFQSDSSLCYVTIVMKTVKLPVV